MKNTHLEHLEDNILNGGSEGGKEAVAFLRSLGDMLDQGMADTRVTVKWDGAPAIICGVNPDNGRFFVGTKSVFNKVNPKEIQFSTRHWRHDGFQKGNPKKESTEVIRFIIAP